MAETLWKFYSPAIASPVGNVILVQFLGLYTHSRKIARDNKANANGKANS